MNFTGKAFLILILSAGLQLQAFSQNHPSPAQVDSIRQELHFAASAGFNLTRQTLQDWSGGIWENFGRYTFFYDSISGRLDYRIFEIFDNSGVGAGGFKNQNKSTYTYDNAGRIILIKQDLWQSNSWGNNFRFTDTYDVNDNLTEQKVEYYTSGNWMTISGKKYDYAYNTSGGVDSLVFLEWNNTLAQHVPKQRFIIANNGGITPSEIQTDTLAGVIWQTVSRKINLTYSSQPSDDFRGWMDASILHYTQQKFQNPLWLNETKADHTYNGMNQLSTIHYQSYSGTAWVDSARTTNDYDAANNITQMLKEKWTGSAWSAVGGNRWSYTYDVNGNITEEVLKVFNNNTWANQKKKINVFDVFASIENLSFADELKLIQAMDNNSVLILYTGEKTLQAQTEIIDQYGRICLSDKVLFAGKTNMLLETEFLASGLYYLRIESPEQSRAFKFLKY